MRLVARAENLSHRYRQRVVLDDVSFELQSGVTGLVGPNGAGKTTIFNLLTRRIKPQSGTCDVLGDDQEPVSEATLRRRVALMPQTFRPPRGMTVAEFMAYLAWLRKVPRKQRPGRATEALMLVDMSEHATDKMTELSGGELQRVMLAQTLLAEPSLILLDEPTAGLDPGQRARIRRLVADIGKERSVLISSHIMEDVATVSDQVLLLAGGHLRFSGTRRNFTTSAALSSAKIRVSLPTRPHS
jgi:ABC-2 type transport system ATP-binding protein